MTIALEDKPGQLKKVAEIVSPLRKQCGVGAARWLIPTCPFPAASLKLTLETRDAEQIDRSAELAKEGFSLERKSIIRRKKKGTFYHESRFHFQRTRSHRPLQPGDRSGQYGVCFPARSQ